MGSSRGKKDGWSMCAGYFRDVNRSDNLYLQVVNNDHSLVAITIVLVMNPGMSTSANFNRPNGEDNCIFF